jgi:hypothetical protein
MGKWEEFEGKEMEIEEFEGKEMEIEEFEGKEMEIEEFEGKEMEIEEFFELPTPFPLKAKKMSSVSINFVMIPGQFS